MILDKIDVAIHDYLFVLLEIWLFTSWKIVFGATIVKIWQFSFTFVYIVFFKMLQVIIVKNNEFINKFHLENLLNFLFFAGFNINLAL